MKTRLTIVCMLLTASMAFASHYPDSIQAAGAEEYRIEKGLNFEIAGGAGIGRHEYKQIGSDFAAPSRHVQNALGFPTWNASFGINYYFVNWFGLGTGVQFSTYANNAQISKPWDITGQDYQNDTYRLTSQPEGLSERQDMYMLEVPLALRFRAIKRTVGFHSALGAKLGFPMHDAYRLSSGELKNQVQYPDLSLPPMSEIGVVSNEKIAGSQGSCLTKLNKLNYAAYAEIGLLFRLHQRLDLSLALAATYYINNVLSATSSASLFDDGQNEFGYSVPTANKHAGILQTSEVASLHPWNVLFKVGLSINTGKTRAQREYDRAMKAERKAAQEAQAAQTVEPQPEPTPTPVVEPEPADEPVVEPERTIEPAVEPEPAPAKKPLLTEQDKNKPITTMKFVLDKNEPIIEDNSTLDQLAAELREHPEKKIRIVGHTCTIGRAAYNMELGMKRAKAVADVLRRRGVRDEQMVLESKGESEPLVRGQHDLSIDRRVEIYPY